MDQFLTDGDESLLNPLELLYPACHHCNGFYGPCFGEPVCATCHEFLYAEDLEHFQRTVRCPASFYGGEKDDGDSGNDEPSEEGPGRLGNFGADQINNVNNGNNPPGLPSPAEEEGEDEEEEIMELRNNGPFLLFPGDREREEDGDVDGPDVLPPPVPIPNGEARLRNHREEEDDTEEEDELNGHHRPAGRALVPFNRPQSSRPQDRLNARLALLTVPRQAHEVLSSDDDMSLRMPPEIWAAIFSKLDDISLAMASKVSLKWKAIVLDQNPNTKWEEFVRLRWPLFSPVYEVENWYQVYCDLIDSVPCKHCFINLTLHIPFDNFQPGRSLRSVRLHKELKWLRQDHPEGIEAVPLDQLNYNWLARISGPPQSPYQGGVFYLNLKIPHDYPLKPPIVRFLTKIIHPNVSRHGDIGIDCIQHNWTLALTIPQVLLSVQSLLTDPYLETNMEPRVSNLYANDTAMFEKVARIWTWKYAMHDVLVH